MTGSYALPASFAQELLWYLDRATPGMTAYNIARARRLRGPLDQAAMRKALDALVARHEILRTTYREHDGAVEQVVGPIAPANFTVRDVQEVEAAGRDAAVARMVRDAAAAPFDLVHGPMLRALLIVSAPDDHVLLIDTHHIASDGRSGAIMFGELFALYEGFVAGVVAPLPELPIQYGDFSAWQRTELQGERLDELLEFWRTQLDGQLPVLELPVDHPRPAVAGYEGEGTGITLSAELVAGLRVLAHRHGASLYMVLLAAYQAMLARWSGQDDIIVGSPIVGRDRPETEGLIGYFANTLVLRSRFADNPSFDTLLRRVRDTALGAYDHQEIPLEKLVLDLQRDGRLRDATLYRAVFTMLDDTPRAGQAAALRVEPAAIRIETAKFDFTLFLADRVEGVSLALLYRTELFETGTARRFLAHLVALLERVTADATLPVLSMPLLPESERQQVARWQGHAAEFDSTPVPQLIAARAATTPDLAAVVCGDHVMSYAELSARAIALAGSLIEAGVRPGDRVGLQLEREAELVAAVQGIWLAGAAYVPLLPELPAARLQALCTGSGARVVVTNAAMHQRVPAGVDAILVDAISSAGATAPVLPAIRPDMLAYVLFTSGSTGTPKGVAVSHANLAHYVQAISARLGLRLDGSMPWRAASVSTLAADLGHTALFPILAGGGTVHLIPNADATDPARWAAITARHPVDLLKITPGHLKALIGDASGPALGMLLPQKWLVLGGEACPPSLVEQVTRAQRCRVLNHYGPTEATVGVCTYAPDEEAAPAETLASVPIGRPLANMRAEVRDPRGQLVGVGIRGELWLGGPQVALGYLGREDLTAERFSVDDDGVRWYRTGDRVRRLGGGALEFLGRLDGQVKVRGHRVELEEIERLVAGVAGVSAAAMALRDDAIAGYVVASADLSDTTLAEAVGRVLPDYMVPASWTRLERLPLNPNGKLDRAALPVPAVSAALDAGSGSAPRGALEQKLAGLWGEVLKRDPPGRDDDFFAIGGHSLIAIRLLGRISKQLGVRLPLRALFEAPTIARQALLLQHPLEAPLAKLWTAVLKREPIARDDDFFALGGHSLVAIRLLGRISKQFGVRLPLRTLFEHPTVARLAPVLELEIQLAQVEALSDADAERLLAAEPEREVNS